MESRFERVIVSRGVRAVRRKRNADNEAAPFCCTTRVLAAGIWIGVKGGVAATINAARALRLADSIGTVAPGMVADLIAVEGDPLQDGSALGRVRFVMSRGRVFVTLDKFMTCCVA